MSSSNDEKLLDVVKTLNVSNTTDSTDNLPSIPEEDTTLEDMVDITTNSFSRILSNTDYLILMSLSSGKGIDSVSEKHGVTKNYIKKLMRSTEGSEFLVNQSKKKVETALAISSTTVAEGVMRYQQYIDDLFAKGQTSLALSYLFGKQSLSEVQAALHKQVSGETPDGTDSLTTLFSSLLTKKED